MPARGAWGLELRAAPAAHDVLEAARPLLYPTDNFPVLTIDQTEFQGPQPSPELSADHALLPLPAGGYAYVGRDDFLVTYHVPVELTADSLVHPYLAGPIAIANTWLGRQVLHAGAVCRDGAVTALAGDREAGKSSLLAVLGARGLPVLTDDLLVLVDGWAFPGPRCVDLRDGASAHLERGRDLGVVGARERHRVDSFTAAPAEGGMLERIVFLEWGSGPKLEDLGAADRLPRLLAQVTVQADIALPDAARMLQLATLRMQVLTRPCDWALVEAGADLLLQGKE